MEDLQHLIGDDYETLDGKPAQVVYVSPDTDSQFPILAVVRGIDGEEFSTWLTRDLCPPFFKPTPRIRRKPKRETREFWLNVYPKNHMDWFKDKYDADANDEAQKGKAGYISRIACVRVEVSFEHGQGL